MARTRQDRRNDFDDFYRTAEQTFTRFRDCDPKAEKFERIYVLNIAPGSRAGGNNKRVVDIFWGNRPFDSITQGNTWKALTEHGATLLFESDDSGFVMISIYPAGTENKRPIESCICLELWIDPKKLKDQSFLKILWCDLMAYMEYTSLDGNPTFRQRMRIIYLRNFKRQIIDSKWQPTKFSIFLQGVFKLVLAACFSGAVLIYFVNIASKPSTSETDALLREVNKNLEVISNELHRISEDSAYYRDISITTDSIAIRAKEILKTIEKRKTK